MSRMFDAGCGLQSHWEGKSVIMPIPGKCCCLQVNEVSWFAGRGPLET